MPHFPQIKILDDNRQWQMVRGRCQMSHIAISVTSLGKRQMGNYDNAHNDRPHLQAHYVVSQWNSLFFSSGGPYMSGCLSIINILRKLVSLWLMKMPTQHLTGDSKRAITGKFWFPCDFDLYHISHKSSEFKDPQILKNHCTSNVEDSLGENTWWLCPSNVSETFL